MRLAERLFRPKDMRPGYIYLAEGGASTPWEPWQRQTSSAHFKPRGHENVRMLKTRNLTLIPAINWPMPEVQA